VGHRTQYPQTPIDPKKKTLRAAERDEALRATFALDLALNLDPSDLVSVDETSTNLVMTRLYARSPQGQRAFGTIPRNHGSPTSLIAALAPQGIQAAFSLIGAVDRFAFRVFVKEVLAPTLRPGQVVALDNLSVHHDPEVRQAIEERDCLLIHLPAYSPDFAPIEPAFSKVKAQLRQIGARSQEALDTAIGTALTTISSEDAHGFFKHSGYLLPAQP
jgi:transposase